jgi:predicted nucleic acid-binding protein
VTIVIDASVAVKWVLDETDSDAADALLDQPLIAPVIWLAEAANALWRSARIGNITFEAANARLSELLNAPVAPVAIEPHIEQALDLAAQLGHPVYDCLYLAIAIQQKTHVITADRRFAALAEQPDLTDRVRLLGA